MTIWLEIGGRIRQVDMGEQVPGGGEHATTTVAVDGTKIEVDARLLWTGTLSLIAGGRQYLCVLDGDGVVVAGKRFGFSLADPRSLAAQQGPTAGADGPRVVKAAMPGRVVRVLVEANDAVEEGQGLIVIEAMKMQNELKSPKKGRVTKIAAAVGTTVGAGDALVVVE